MLELTERQKIILSLVVHEHTRTAQPVASKSLIEDYGLQVSSATVRNDLNTLTELGLLRQPHTSAGRVPTEEGYRFFVSNLVKQTSLPVNTRNTISHQFYQSRRGLDQWLPLAASVLANQAQAVSIVTAPHSKKVRFKHLELISTRASQVLMVLVLVGGEIRQQIISTSQVLTQEQLYTIANLINQVCENCHLQQIRRLEIELASDLVGGQASNYIGGKASASIKEDTTEIKAAIEAIRTKVSQIPDNLKAVAGEVATAVREHMQLASELVTGELYLDGLSNVLAEPEFAEAMTARSPLKLLEERPLLDDLISRTVMTEDIGGVQILIGGEGTWQELRNCSVILTRYGIAEQASGTLGVLGPMRMPYGHTISTVRFMADLLSGLVSETLIE